MENTIVQKIKVPVTDIYSKAEKYYSVLSAVNGIGLTTREIQLVAFTAISGNISYAKYREDFCKKYNTTPPTINNIISKLKKMGILVKENGKVKVNPLIMVNFERQLVLQISVTV